MQTYLLTGKIDYLIDEARREEERDARLSAITGTEISDLTKPGLLEALPGYRTTGKTEGYLRGLLYGGQVLGYQVLTVTNTEAVSCDLPPHVKYAVFLVEADATASDQTRCIRYKSKGEDDLPTDSAGIPIGHLGVFQIGHPINLYKLRLIGVEAGKTHSVQVEYYG